MFGLSTYTNLVLVVSLLLAAVIGIPLIRARIQHRRKDVPQDIVPPLNTIRTSPDTKPQDQA